MAPATLRALLVFLFVFAFRGSPAAAQQPDERAAPDPVAAEERSTREGIEEITVTARKREESLQRVPVSVTAFSAQDLHNQSMEDMSELTWQTPNFELRNTPVSRTQAAMTLRSITVLDAAPTLESAVGIYLDGVYIHPLTTALFNFIDFERIEVLKGPQGTLFGRNTIGGAINLVSKKPDGRFGGIAKVTLGSYDRRDFSGAVSFPILGETLSARVAFLTTHHDHYTRDTFAPEDEQEDERINGGRASLRWAPTEDFDVVLAWDRLEDHSGVSSQQNLAVNQNDFIFRLANELHGPGGTNALAQFGVSNIGDLLDGHPRRVGVNFSTKDDTENWGFSGTMSWDVGPFTIKSITAHRELSRTLNVDFDGFPISFFEAEGRASSRSFSQELQLQGLAFEDRLNWTAGAFYFDESGYSDSFRLFLKDTIQFGSPSLGAPPGGFLNFTAFDQVRPENEAWALFGHGTFQLTDRLSLTAGLRFTKERRAAQYINGEGLPGENDFVPPFIPLAFAPPEFQRCRLISEGGATQPYPRSDQRCKADVDQRFDGWSYTAGLEFQATDDLMVYLKASRGFKSGGFDGRPSDNPAQLEPFDPEKLTSYELGVKSQWFDNRLRANAAFFYSSYVDQQLTRQGVSDILFGRTFTFITNVGRSYIQGVEFDFAAAPLTGLFLAGNIGVSYGRYKDFKDAERIATSPTGVPVLGVRQRAGEEFGEPFIKYGLTAAYTLPAFDFGTLSLRADYVWRSRDPQTDAPTGLPRVLDQSPFGLLNARLALFHEEQNLELALFCKNCFDRVYWTGEVDTRAGLGYAQAYYGAPRTVGVELTYRFGADRI